MKRKLVSDALPSCLMLFVALVGFVLLCVCQSGCQITTEGMKVLESEESLEIQNIAVLDENSIEVQFNKEVSVKEAKVSKLDSQEQSSLDALGENAVGANAVLSEDAKTVVYEFQESTDVGERYQLFSEIEDSRGNSLTFAIPFEGYNNRIPILIITELQGATGDKTVKGVKTKRCEYIVLRALTAGNLAGIELYSARYKGLSEYRFPAIEVKAGEHIMIHLRTYEGQDYTEELGDDLSLDKNNDESWSTIRDLYYENSDPCASKEYDIVLLRNRTTAKVMDALLYTLESKKENYSKLSAAEKLATDEGKWKSEGEESDPIILQKTLTATTQSLQRTNSEELFALAKKGELEQDDITTSKNDWQIGLTLYNVKRTSIY
ncbi:MAG: hypothetical protein K2N58_08230 [Treponemataceae bacterium]|nr:hypothetical protein [Treponemataceae bacterium]